MRDGHSIVDLQDTSAEALASIRESLGGLRLDFLDRIEKSGADGKTCDELEVDSGQKHQTVSARLRELRGYGLIVDSKRRRPTRSDRDAIVWVARSYDAQASSTGQGIPFSG